MSERAFGYIRVSGNSQVEGDGPKRQKVAIEAFATSNALGLEQIFSDLAVSGTVDGLDRAGFASMVVACESSGCKTIIVEKQERFARDLMVSEVLFEELRKRGIRLLACDRGTEDLVSAKDDPTRMMLRQLFGVLAQYEKSSLVTKLRVARERAIAAGGKAGAPPTYGQGKSLRAATEKRILDLISQLREIGATWDTVALALTNGGFEKRGGSTQWKRQEAWSLYGRAQARKAKQPTV